MCQVKQLQIKYSTCCLEICDWSFVAPNIASTLCYHFQTSKQVTYFKDKNVWGSTQILIRLAFNWIYTKHRWNANKNLLSAETPIFTRKGIVYTLQNFKYFYLRHFCVKSSISSFLFSPNRSNVQGEKTKQQNSSPDFPRHVPKAVRINQ